MSKTLTKKTMVLVSKLGDFWVTPDQGKEIIAWKKGDPFGSLDIDGSMISCQSIDGLLTAAQYEIYNKKKNGYWQCRYEYWHERFQQCAHMHIRRDK